jgi:hypothetical protein
MVKAKLLKSAVCECGHDKPTHGTGLAVYGSHDYACTIVACNCKVFELEVVPKVSRPRVVKTLDKDEPKLFDI